MLFLSALAKKKFKQFLEKGYLEEVTVEPLIQRYKVYNEEDLVSKAVCADLIIMGFQGLTPQDVKFAGSNPKKWFEIATLMC